MVLYISTFLTALFVTIVATPMASRIAQKIGAVDHPSDRKIHTSIIPRLGGLAIFIGFVVAILLSLMLASALGMQVDVRLILGVVLAASVMFLCGLVDDIKGLKPLQKLAWQGLAAGIVLLFGSEITFISNPFNGIFALGFIGVPLTIFWLVGVTNAINLIDGLDGLAAGVTAISAAALFFVALRTHQIGAALLLISLTGAAVGFLRFNFFPAKIFLGDSGSLFLGFILAASSIVGVFKTTLVVALVIPVLILGVPIFDTLFAIGRRLKDRRHPFEADDKHIHHMFLRAGFSQRETVLSIYIACFLLSFSAVFLALQR
ncbi:MAG: MraY family glycosyltransferase [Candidatus Margulisiibacteriota bacterium]|nr:undecaprenyl/decaprenyl-phosphate alpha-N-acetylglucosaminyl 1-phosphate transferase [Candidatus Margulisiibacteriota bacterium]